MASYKVQKEVRQSARIFGLEMNFFYVFAAFALLLIFSLIGGKISFLKLVIILVLVGLDYVVMMSIQKVDISKFIAAIPKIIENK